MSQVKFEGVGKTYIENNVSVVDNFNLTIKDGEFVSFLGPSGCGKTTTLRMLAGLEKNTHGKIYLEPAIEPIPRLAQRLSFLPEAKNPES